MYVRRPSGQVTHSRVPRLTVPAASLHRPADGRVGRFACHLCLSESAHPVRGVSRAPGERPSDPPAAHGGCRRTLVAQKRVSRPRAAGGSCGGFRMTGGCRLWGGCGLNADTAQGEGKALEECLPFTASEGWPGALCTPARGRGQPGGRVGPLWQRRKQVIAKGGLVAPKPWAKGA